MRALRSFVKKPKRAASFFRKRRAFKMGRKSRENKILCKYRKKRKGYNESEIIGYGDKETEDFI